MLQYRAPQLLDEYHSNLMLLRQRLFLSGCVLHTLAFYVTFRHTWDGAASVCDHRNIIPRFDATPCLLQKYMGPCVTSACKVYKALVLGQIFCCQPSVLCVVCVAHYRNCLFAFSKKTNHSWALSKIRRAAAAS